MLLQPTQSSPPLSTSAPLYFTTSHSPQNTHRVETEDAQVLSSPLLAQALQRLDWTLDSFLHHKRPHQTRHS